MSTEALQLLCAMDRSRLQVQIGLQCAPLLAGIKISNLLAAPAFMKRRIDRIFRKSEIFCYLLYESDRKSTFLLYHRGDLLQALKQPDVQRTLEELGYDALDLKDILSRTAQRYKAHMEYGTEFPHELGILLGYPLQDVLGFMVHGGKNFLYSGYWKVYGNLQEALDTFRCYDAAREQVVHMISRGMSVPEILERLKEPLSDAINVQEEWENEQDLCSLLVTDGEYPVYGRCSSPGYSGRRAGSPGCGSLSNICC